MALFVSHQSVASALLHINGIRMRNTLGAIKVCAELRHRHKMSDLNHTAMRRAISFIPIFTPAMAKTKQVTHLMSKAVQ